VIVVCDTNILLRSVQPDHPHSLEANHAIEKLLSQGHEVVILFQNIAEFWNVATRPAAKNGLGYSISETNGILDRLLDSFTILAERLEVVERWRQLVVTHAVKGVQVHDARIAAVMMVHGIGNLLTYNGADFKRFTEITVLTPSSLLVS
jgi:predicted nucleic acid-binding protein